MRKRIVAVLLAISLLLTTPVTAFACDEEQSNLYVLQILFGDNASYYEDDANVSKLLSALYICSEQANKDGQEKLNALKKAKVGGVPTLAKINVNGEDLFDCSHNSWDHVSTSAKKAQEARKGLLRKTVVKVFDFGWFNEIFRSNSGQIDSFAALLYYSHILADYLADDPLDTAVNANGYDIPAYSGSPAVELNGNRPTFTSRQKKETDSYKEYSDLDAYGRCGSGITNIGPDTLSNVTIRGDINKIYPTGWQTGNVKYDGIMASELYNRCHLVAHSLGGADTRWNLLTGTRYLNEAMEKYELKVAEYIKQTGNHVLYRATPVYVGTNAVASGVQLEAYSIEDNGKGISFNVYLYNVQPGVNIDYANGKSELADQTVNSGDIIPFSTINPSDSNPDLMYEINKQLELLFADQKNNADYASLMNELGTVADEARNVSGNKDWQVYSALKQCQFKYVQVFSEYVPKLLAKEAFFNSVFK